MTMVPFTRSVHARIVADARLGIPATSIARELSWPLDRLARVAQVHGIKLTMPLEPLPIAVVVPACPAAPPSLTDMQTRVLVCLSRTPGEYLTENDMASRTGIQRGSIRTIMRVLRNKLPPGSLLSRRNQGGGYVLMNITDPAVKALISK